MRPILAWFANPVLMKELRGRMRGNRTLILLIIYLVFTGTITLLVYMAFASSISRGPGIEEGSSIGKAIFLTVIFTTLIQICFITPSLTAGSIAGERERQSYDLLITTLLSPAQIIFGKLGAALAFAVLLIVAVLPMAALSFLFGGVSGIELLISLVVLLVTVVLFASIGIFWSTITTSTLAATVRAQATILLLLLVVPLFLIILAITGLGRVLDDIEVLETLVNTPIFLYTMEVIFCTHPFIALIFTIVSLTEGESPFFFEIDPGRGDILIPSPWLVYTFVGLLITAMLIFLSVRLLRPVHYRVPRRSAISKHKGTLDEKGGSI